MSIVINTIVDNKKIHVNYNEIQHLNHLVEQYNNCDDKDIYNLYIFLSSVKINIYIYHKNINDYLFYFKQLKTDNEKNQLLKDLNYLDYNQIDRLKKQIINNYYLELKIPTLTEALNKNSNVINKSIDVNFFNQKPIYQFIKDNKYKHLIKYIEIHNYKHYTPEIENRIRKQKIVPIKYTIIIHNKTIDELLKDNTIRFYNHFIETTYNYTTIQNIIDICHILNLEYPLKQIGNNVELDYITFGTYSFTFDFKLYEKYNSLMYHYDCITKFYLPIIKSNIDYKLNLGISYIEHDILIQNKIEPKMTSIYKYLIPTDLLTIDTFEKIDNKIRYPKLNQSITDILIQSLNTCLDIGIYELILLVGYDKNNHIIENGIEFYSKENKLILDEIKNIPELNKNYIEKYSYNSVSNLPLFQNINKSINVLYPKDTWKISNNRHLHEIYFIDNKDIHITNPEITKLKIIILNDKSYMFFGSLFTTQLIY